MTVLHDYAKRDTKKRGPAAVSANVHNVLCNRHVPTCALLVKARGGFKVAGKPDTPEVAKVRQESMITAQLELKRRGISWEKKA